MTAVFKNTNRQSVFATVGIIIVAYFVMRWVIALYKVFELKDEFSYEISNAETGVREVITQKPTVVHATYEQMERDAQLDDHDFYHAKEYKGIRTDDFITCVHVFGKDVYCNEDDYFLNRDIPYHLSYVRFLMFMILPIVLRHVNHGAPWYKWVAVYIALLVAGYMMSYGKFKLM